MLLADKSALVRSVSEVSEGDELCICAVTRIEMLYSARNAQEYNQVEEGLTEASASYVRTWRPSRSPAAPSVSWQSARSIASRPLTC